jgi:hypothetical protein
MVKRRFPVALAAEDRRGGGLKDPIRSRNSWASKHFAVQQLYCNLWPAYDPVFIKIHVFELVPKL